MRSSVFKRLKRVLCKRRIDWKRCRRIYYFIIRWMLDAFIKSKLKPVVRAVVLHTAKIRSKNYIAGSAPQWRCLLFFSRFNPKMLFVSIKKFIPLARLPSPTRRLIMPSSRRRLVGRVGSSILGRRAPRGGHRPVKTTEKLSSEFGLKNTWQHLPN